MSRVEWRCWGVPTYLQPGYWPCHQVVGPFSICTSFKYCTVLQAFILNVCACVLIACSAMTLLAGRQKLHLACKNVSVGIAVGVMWLKFPVGEPLPPPSSLRLHFNGHFPGKPGLASFTEAKDDGGGDRGVHKHTTWCRLRIKNPSGQNSDAIGGGHVCLLHVRRSMQLYIVQ